MDGKRLLDQVRDKIRAKHYSIRTEEAYLHWVKRFILFHRKRHPRDLGAKEVEAFLSHSAVARKVSASTQNQAKSALLFLYKEVLQVDLPWLTDIVSAKRPTRLPVVLTQSEVAELLAHTSGTSGLILRMVYGTGMRIMECMRLRVKDIDFERAEITIREGKGFKDRMTMLPKSVVRPLQEHLGRVRLLHEQDLRDGHGEVFMTYALARKYPNAGRSWIWVAHARPCARGISTSLYSTVCIPIDTAIDRSALGCGASAALVRTDDQKSGSARRETRAPREAGVAARAAPFVRDAYAAGGVRYSHRPRTARPRRPQHHHDLHPRAESRRPGRAEPA